MLCIKNKKKKITERTRIAGSFWEKFRGLMLERKKNFNYALIFDFNEEKRIEASIHMLFVFFSIDLVYLSKEKRVVELKEGIKPWTLNFTPKKKARFLIELPEGTIKGKGIELKDEIEWTLI